jgi:hypothetical protein
MNSTPEPYREKLRACQWFCALPETLQEDLIARNDEGLGKPERCLPPVERNKIGNAGQTVRPSGLAKATTA